MVTPSVRPAVNPEGEGARGEGPLVPEGKGLVGTRWLNGTLPTDADTFVVVEDNPGDEYVRIDWADGAGTGLWERDRLARDFTRLPATKEGT